MNGVTLSARTDEDIMQFSQVDFEIEAVIHCAPGFTVPPLPLHACLLCAAQHQNDPLTSLLFVFAEVSLLETIFQKSNLLELF